MSLEQMVIDDDIFRFLNRSVRGMEVNDDTLAAQTIAKLDWQAVSNQEHILRHFGKEFFLAAVVTVSNKE